MKPIAVLLGLAGLSIAVPNPQLTRGDATYKRATWPNGPFVTSDRWILDASGNNLTYAGANWPGHNDVMIPEGLQYQSIETIVEKIKSLGMNAVRLTFAIQMIDEIYANGGQDITIQRAFVQALGQVNGTRVLNQVLAKNPRFTASTTRLQVFDAVAEELAKQELYIHLDNHVSKGMWCCSGTDGNSWWGDTHFSAANWIRGLTYMANHGRSWRGLTSLSLRNELREPTSNPFLARTSYNWQTWYTYMQQGASAVHSANPSLLIFLSGLNYDTTLTPVVRGEALTPGTTRFNARDFAAGAEGGGGGGAGYADKLVLELHNYETGIDSCSSLRGNLARNGFESMSAAGGNPGGGGSPVANVLPVMLTEFGFQMDASTWRDVYASCLAEWLPAQKAGWFIWVLAGSYYIRSGIQDYDEGWGLLTRDWSAWRSPEFVEGALREMVRGTLS